MAAVDDLVTAALLASAFFFVALAFGLLVRYRQISQKITESSDLGHDLWQALEQKMKRQDERILDVMGRLEVVQSRVLTAAAAQAPAGPPPTPALPPRAQAAQEVTPDVMSSARTAQHPELQPESQASRTQASEIRLDETQLKVVGLLVEGPKNTRQLTDAIGVSREHTARLMKALFDAGIVGRNDATKPFVYQLTDQGRKYVPVGPG